MAIVKISKYFFSNDKTLLFISLLLLVTAGIVNVNNPRPVINLSKQETALNINKSLLIFMSAGNKRLITDLLWVQTLIESDLEHYKKRDLNNWLFLRFITIATLDPKFYENYLYGGQFLAIAKDDLEGADALYEKGLTIYPNDYRLNFGAGFLNYYEMGNFEKGLNYLQKIKHHPLAPHYINSIINKLQLAAGVDIKTIFDLVLHEYELTKDKALKKKLRNELYALKAELDLKCLNNNGENCDRRDFAGNPYIEKNGLYFSPESFIKYQINKRGDIRLPPDQRKINFLK